jgi:general secretion pathway protein A
MTNIETSKHKLQQIVLVGQPELDQNLDSPELRQVKQRIALRYSLEPMTEMEVRGYINRRLEIAGAPGRALQIFPPPTLARILHYAHGIPRMVNNICDGALVNGYGNQAKTISPAIIDEVAADLRLSLKNAAGKLTGTPLTVNSPEEDMSRKMLVRTLLRLARLLEPGLAMENDKNQGVAG